MHKQKNNTQIDNAEDINVAMPTYNLMYNLIEYSDNYSKISGSVWLFYRDEPALDDKGIVVAFADNYNTN